MELTISPQHFRKVLGAYPTGVCVIAAMVDGQPQGMVVGSFTSVSIDPPLVGFLPGKDSKSWPLIEQAGKFSVNVMGDGQGDVCRAVAAKGEAKFAGVDYTVSDYGVPIIANAIACIECNLYGVTEAGDHWFVMGEVLRLDVHREDEPMLFHLGQYRTMAPRA